MQSWILAIRGVGLLVGLVGACSQGIESCSPHDTKGESDRFDVIGRVVEVDGHEAKLDILQITLAEGRAEGRFEIGEETEVRDYYRTNKTCKKVDVGEEYALDGSKLDLSDFEEGDRVHAEGRIRDSHEVCGDHSDWDVRQVYTRFETAKG